MNTILSILPLLTTNLKHLILPNIRYDAREDMFHMLQIKHHRKKHKAESWEI